jgi:hypothetical protein
MSELVIRQNAEQGLRKHLLMTACGLALLSSANIGDARAADEDADRPTVWIELGGDLQHVSGQGESFPVGFLTKYPNSPVLQKITPLQAQNPPPFDFGGDGKISFQPENSDWVFSANVVYGRSSNFKHADQQTNGTFFVKYQYGIRNPQSNIRGVDDFANTKVSRRETHSVLDFSAGRDVGLGLFGKNASSVFSIGVRIAQFTSKSTFDVRARPDLQFKYAHPTAHDTIKAFYFHTYHNTGNASRGFHGIGPSLSWDASSPVLGAQQGGQVSIDWGLNAALLFGRQKAHVQHQESGHYATPAFFLNGEYFTAYQHPPAGHDTDRSVVVPNVGGFVGATYRVEDFKVKLGYRADFFFGAIDGGIDTRKSEMLGFYGPFASVSVGLGG